MLQISDVRLHEHVARLATHFAQGVTAEEYRQAAFPSSKSTRGSRRLLGELVRRDIVETRADKYVLSARGWLLFRGELEDAGGQLDDEDEPDDWWPSELHRSAIESGHAPSPPRGPWLPDPDSNGGFYCVGPDGLRWSGVPPELPRAQSGPFVFSWNGYHAICERRADFDYAARAARAQQPTHTNGNAPQPMQPQEPAWPVPRLGPDGKWWNFDGANFLLWNGYSWTRWVQP